MTAVTRPQPPLVGARDRLQASRRLPAAPSGSPRAGARQTGPGDRSNDAPAPARVRGRTRLLREVATFGGIGVVSTAAYVILYAALRTFSPAAVANAVALLVTAVGNTAANRRLTFSVQGRERLLRDHAAGIVALGVALAITSLSLGVLAVAAPHAGPRVELAVLVAANALATLVRFATLRLAVAGASSGTARVPVRASLGPTGSIDRIAR